MRFLGMIVLQQHHNDPTRLSLLPPDRLILGGSNKNTSEPGIAAKFRGETL